MEESNILVGKTIKAVFLAEDRRAVKFVLADDSEIVARCDADCCSYTWIENFEMPDNMLGTVIEADGIDMPDQGDMEGRDVVRYYGFRIVTERGICTIDYRNDSNGYYGGNLSWPNDSYYGGVYQQNVSAEQWQKLV